MIFITSWDDGHPLDERLADLLLKWGIKGTFYVPFDNSEGLKVLSSSSIRYIATQHELASHTLDHIYLNKLSSADCRKQVCEGKSALEMIVGHEIKGFCYPGGVYNASIREHVISAGFAHARTTKNLCMNRFEDKFLIPTTFQFYPHQKSTLIWNYLKGADYIHRYKTLNSLISNQSWLDNMIKFVISQSETDNIIHVWGHSWEIDSLNLWGQLDMFLGFVSSLRPISFSVGDFVDANIP